MCWIKSSGVRDWLVKGCLETLALNHLMLPDTKSDLGHLSQYCRFWQAAASKLRQRVIFPNTYHLRPFHWRCQGLNLKPPACKATGKPACTAEIFSGPVLQSWLRSSSRSPKLQKEKGLFHPTYPFYPKSRDKLWSPLHSRYMNMWSFVNNAWLPGSTTDHHVHFSPPTHSHILTFECPVETAADFHHGKWFLSEKHNPSIYIKLHC